LRQLRRRTCSDPVNVSELRQYHFCPMVVYFHSTGIYEEEKEYMKAGKERQEDLMRKERRRETLAGLRKLKVDERIQGLRLSSSRLCLTGVLDLAVRIGEEWAVVEVKSGKRPEVPSLGHRVQLAAYSMLLEERLSRVVRRGFILYEDGIVEVEISEGLRRHVLWTLDRIREIIEGRIPEVNRSGKCRSCGYSLHCL